MFIGKDKLERKLTEVKNTAQVEFNDIIKSWHESYERTQRDLESKFDIGEISSWSINVWDEIESDDSTFIFVEMNEVPDSICFSILNHIWQYLRQNDVSNVSFRFYDSTNIYPSNLLNETGRYTSFKRWELRLENISYESLNTVVGLLKQAPSFNDKKLDVYSES